MSSRLIVREIAETFIIVMLVFLALQIAVRTYQVEGYSMAPTMDHTDYVLVNKIVYTKFEKNVLNNFLPFFDMESEEVMFPFHSPQRGEIVIFRYPQDESREFVKRVVGIPGDTVEINFIANRVGVFEFFCNVFCGEGHSKHRGNLIVV